MVDSVGKAFSHSGNDFSKGRSVKDETLRRPVFTDLPLHVQKTKSNAKSRKLILNAFKKNSEENDSKLAVMQTLFDQRLSSCKPGLLKALIQPLE